MRNLIINADDFGMSAEVNEGIKQGISSGLVNSVSVMVNLPYFNDAVEFLKKHPEISVGLHFNVTEGGPLLAPREVGSLLKEDNNFYHFIQLLFRLSLGKAKIQDIEKEFLCQYEKLKQTGLKITNIDSHHHIHLYPSIFKFVTKFADQEKIKSLRCHRFNLWSLDAGIGKKPTLKQLIIVLFLWFDSLFYNHHLYEVDGFYDLNWDKNLREKDFLKILDCLPQGTTELICHLGVLSPSGNRKFLEPRQKVLQLLQQKSVQERFLQNSIHLWQ